MSFAIWIPLGGEGKGRNWLSLLISGISMLGGSVFSFAISATTRNPDPTDFFYDFDNDQATVFAVMGAILLVVGLIMVVLSFRVRSEERLQLETQQKAEEEARKRDIEEIAKAVKSTIKVRCQYCNTLNDEGVPKCSSCGATL